MTSICCVVGCSKRVDRDKGVQFFPFPALHKNHIDLSLRRINAWLSSIQRTDLRINSFKDTQICSSHFTTGKPAYLLDTQHPDWVPTVNMGSKPFIKCRQRGDNNKNISPNNQTNLMKVRSTSGVQRLSKMEKLKLEIKSKDEIIKNYKDERQLWEQEQHQVVNDYEQRLKEKDVKIAKGNRDREIRNRSSGVKEEEQNQNKSGVVTMRFGRKLKKAIVEPEKTKPCFVRLQKVHEEKQEQPKRSPANRKLTGPLKKRPLNTPVQSVKKVEPLTTVASTRSRRAPKPNPKYANADIITPKAKPRRAKGHPALGDDEEYDSGNDYYDDLNESSNDTDTNDGDPGEPFEADDSSDFSENDELLMKMKRPTRSTPAPTGRSSSVAKRGRANAKLSPLPPIPKPVKPIEARKNNQQQQPLMQRTVTTTVVSQQLQQSRKRKLDDVAKEEEPVESIIARNKRLNIALYDANVAKPLPTVKNAAAKTISTVGISRTQSPTAASAVIQRRLVQAPSSARSTAPSTQEEKVKSPLHRRSPAIAPKSVEADDLASTQDDFETMPTFTIVNIHDIINKKGNSLSQSNPDESKDSTSPNSNNRVNRRKTGHTTILSEKLDPGKLRTPLPRSPFPPRKPIPTILNSSTSTTRSESRAQQRTLLSQAEKKPVPVVAEKPAPRILNSVVAKRTYPVQPILGKLDNDSDLDQMDDGAEKTQMVKENVGANKVLSTKPPQPRKLPPEKVFVQRQGNKLIKKITCFETWYVINIPETQEPVVKNCLDMPLITLSNAVKTIKLPSSAWSTKVTLYKLSAQMMGKSNLTPYTGDLSDQSISEEDRDKYQPSCVMFRRMTQQKSKTRMPYDRAVIFKLKTFFTNIDGKNVRLIGAPSTISAFEEIEVLLELVDELDLMHEFVEPASTV